MFKGSIGKKRKGKLAMAGFAVVKGYAGNFIYMEDVFGEGYGFPKVVDGFYYFFDR